MRPSDPCLPRTLTSPPAVSPSRVHVFFGNERTVGDTAFKCAEGAEAFVKKAGISSTQVHRFSAGNPKAAAKAYEEMLRGMPVEVAGEWMEEGKGRFGGVAGA